MSKHFLHFFFLLQWIFCEICMTFHRNSILELTFRMEHQYNTGKKKKVKVGGKACKYIIILVHSYHLRECFHSQLVEKLTTDSSKQLQLWIQYKFPLVYTEFCLFTMTYLHAWKSRNYVVTIVKLQSVTIKKNNSRHP